MNNSLTMTQEQLANRKDAAMWLLLLGPFFFISYGFANWLASGQAEVYHIVFAWEKSIPFVPWAIIPYWSIDLLYVMSLFICSSKVELDRHAKRLLSAQIIAVICFILWPMGFTFERPETSGFVGSLFSTLSSFDQPFNQAPSLHIALLVILWSTYPRHLPELLRWPFHVLCLLIAVSVLTTYQHHFIDMPSGALLGWFCVWLWPEDGRSMLTRCSEQKNNFDQNKRRYRLACYYLFAALLFSVLALTINGWALWLLWPAFSLLMVAVFYAIIGATGFQKKSNGKMSDASQWLLLPYLLAARLNSFLWTKAWTKKYPSANHIMDGLWLGRFPSAKEITENNYHTIIDMTAEMLMPCRAQSGSITWHTLANLDLLMPSEKNLLSAAKLIEQHMNNHPHKPILVACALGYSRSVMAVCFWLVYTYRAKNMHEALLLIKSKQQKCVIKKSDYELLTVFIEKQQDGK